MNEGVASILQSLRNSDLEGAKRIIDSLAPGVRTDRERGALLAVTGIYTSLLKSKEGTMQSWDQGRVLRAAQSISASQMADEIDLGYSETLASYSRLMQTSA
ncbi:MAG: hypothetical protein HY296_03485 [Thaumarchaeota archaeon]|nr:hypothetical protein [Nitrososphaerota archaeon]